MLPPRMTDYAATAAGFRWTVPERFNFARDVVDHWAADPAKPALVWCNDTGTERRFTFDGIARASRRFANLLGRARRGQGRPGRGDATAPARVADRDGRYPARRRDSDPVHRHADREGRDVPRRTLRRGRGGDHCGEHGEVRGCRAVQAARLGRRRRRLARAPRGARDAARDVRRRRARRRRSRDHVLHVGLDREPEGGDARGARDLGVARVGVVLARPPAGRLHVVHRGHRLEQGGHEHPVRPVELRRAGALLRRPLRSAVPPGAPCAAPGHGVLCRRHRAAPSDRRGLLGVRSLGAAARGVRGGNGQPGGRAALGARRPACRCSTATGRPRR